MRPTAPPRGIAAGTAGAEAAQARIVMEDLEDMGEMQYVPIYEEWVDLMEAKDTPEKRVAFMEGIFRYAFGGERPPNPMEMERPHGVDYARYDGYVICRKSVDRMRRAVSVGAKGGSARSSNGARGATAVARGVPEGRGGKGGGDDAKGGATPPKDADGPDAPSPVAGQEGDGGFDAERSCRRPSLPTEDEMRMFASNVGVPHEYLKRFLARQEELGWEYVNRAGSVVRLCRRNFKSVLRSFWEQDEAERRRKGAGSTQPPGVVLKGEMANDYGF